MTSDVADAREQLQLSALASHDIVVVVISMKHAEKEMCILILIDKHLANVCFALSDDLAPVAMTDAALVAHLIHNATFAYVAYPSMKTNATTTTTKMTFDSVCIKLTVRLELTTFSLRVRRSAIRSYASKKGQWRVELHYTWATTKPRTTMRSDPNKKVPGEIRITRCRVEADCSVPLSYGNAFLSTALDHTRQSQSCTGDSDSPADTYSDDRAWECHVSQCVSSLDDIRDSEHSTSQALSCVALYSTTTLYD